MIYDTPAYNMLVGGDFGGYLLAATIHNFMLAENIEVFGWELQAQQSYEDMLLQVVGNTFSSELNLGNGWGFINTTLGWRSLNVI